MSGDIDIRRTEPIRGAIPSVPKPADTDNDVRKLTLSDFPGTVQVTGYRRSTLLEWLKEPVWAVVQILPYCRGGKPVLLVEVKHAQSQ